MNRDSAVADRNVALPLNSTEDDAETEQIDCRGNCESPPILTEAEKHELAVKSLRGPVLSGDLANVRKLLCRGTCVDVKDLFGRTPLHWAVGKNNLEMTELLLQWGSDVNAKDKSDGVTPLHEASSCAGAEVVKMLLEKGARVNCVDGCGRTPLHRSVSENRLEIAELLLESGAEISNGDYRGCTPLHTAANHDADAELVKLLLTRGADINAKDEDCWTPFHCAVRHKLEIAKLLVEWGADVNGNEVDETTPLHEASQYADAEIVKWLLSKGAFVNAKDKHKRTPLHCAIRENESEIAELLLEWGAEVSNGDYRGCTPLHTAVSYDVDAELVKMLLRNGACVNAKDVNGHPPLYYAVSHDKVKMVQLLVEWDADVNAKVNGYTLLHSAARLGNVEIAESLLMWGADVNAKNHRGETPLGVAATGDVKRILKRHVIKCKSANLFVSDGNLRAVSQDEQMTSFQLECEDEVERMKHERLWDEFSFFQLLTKNVYQLARLHAVNEIIVQAMKPDDFDTEFPIYGSILNFRFHAFIERKELLEADYRNFNSVPYLPADCISEILDYLSSKDLKNCYEVFCK